LRGTIRVVSAPGRGTTFKILLPCAEHTVPADRAGISTAGKGKLRSREATVLVVEDEDALRQAVSKMLRKVGFSVIEASNGSVALELISAHKEDLDMILLDITLPGLSSREVFEEARRLRPDVPVVVTSAYSEKMAAKSLSGVVEYFIRK